jgi:hypothetical protein
MEQGQCGVRGGMCVAVSEADCKKSAQCKERAQCVLVGNSCTMAD